jgi:hypothetical protein
MRGITDAIVFEVVKDARTSWIGVLMSSPVAGVRTVIFQLPRGRRHLQCQCPRRSSPDIIPARRAWRARRALPARRAMKTPTVRRGRPANRGVEAGSEKHTRELVLLREQSMGSKSPPAEMPPGDIAVAAARRGASPHWRHPLPRFPCRLRGRIFINRAVRSRRASGLSPWIANAYGLVNGLASAVQAAVPSVEPAPDGIRPPTVDDQEADRTAARLESERPTPPRSLICPRSVIEETFGSMDGVPRVVRHWKHSARTPPNPFGLRFR